MPVEVPSRVVSYDWLGSTALRPVGLALMGPLVGLVGLRATVYTLVATFGAAGCAPLAVRATWRVRSR